MVSKLTYVIAIDVMSMTKEELAKASLNSKLLEILDVPQDKAEVKLLVLQNIESESLDNVNRLDKIDSFNDAIISIPSYNRDMVESLDEFIFKLGLNIGQGKHILLFTNRNIDLSAILEKESQEATLNEETKTQDKSISYCPKYGIIKQYAAKKLGSFKLRHLAALEDAFYLKYSPNYWKLSELTDIDNTVDELCKKLWKQFQSTQEMDWIKFANTCQNLITQHLGSLKNKSHKDFDMKNYLLPRIFQKLSEDEIIDWQATQLLLESQIHHAKKFIASFGLNVDCKKFNEKYGTANKLLNVIISAQSKDLKSSENSILSASTLCESQATDSTYDTLSRKHWVDKNYDDCSDLDELEMDMSYLDEITQHNISKDDAIDLMNTIISLFFVKYEQANYENIKRYSKLENAVLNFVIQQLESKKLKKKFISLYDKLTPQTVGVALLKFLLFSDWLRIEGTKVIHDERKISKEKEKFETIF